MLTLYSYPTLFGVADNNGYGLKVFAFLRLAGVPFRHEHIFDASKAPRSQLPYIVDGNDIVGDSETILAYVTQKYRLTIDAGLTPAQRTTNLLITRMLDDLYWVMSYSRWKDERYWHAFRDALLREHPTLTGRKPGQGAGVQFSALLLPRHWPLRSRCRPWLAGSRISRRLPL
jgi:glutathione S-transferase